MKKKLPVVIGIFLIILAILSFFTNYIDGGRVATNHEPRFCIKLISNDGSKVTYWGLGYKVIRYVGVSPKEPFSSNIGVKMGNWFMKYDLKGKDKDDEVVIEKVNQTAIKNNEKIVITDYKDISNLENILINSKYDRELCKGITNYSIKLGKETFYLKADCREIQRGNKQAELTDEDYNIIMEIIKNNK